MIKVLLSVVFLVCLSTLANAQATATLRQGQFVDQYAISDPGNASGFNNIRIIISHKVAEVVIQWAGNNFRTRKGSLLCWEDPDEVLCPNDDIDPGPAVVYREPEIVFLDNIMAAGGVTIGAPLALSREREIYLAFWYEYRTKRLVTNSIAEMQLEGLNVNQQKRALKYIYFAQGIDFLTAAALAADRIDFGTVATYMDLGLPTIPVHDRRLLRLFGQVGWFE